MITELSISELKLELDNWSYFQRILTGSNSNSGQISKLNHTSNERALQAKKAKTYYSKDSHSQLTAINGLSKQSENLILTFL